MALFTEPVWVSILLIFPLLLLLIILKKRSKGLLPPGPPKFPIIGNAHLLGGIPHVSLWKLSQKYGPVMLLHLGRFPTVVVSSAEAAKEVMKTHDAEFCSRPRLAAVRKLSYNYLDIAFSPYSDNWRAMRKVTVSEIFSLKRVQSFNPLRQEEVDLMISSIAESASTGSTVNITDQLFALLAHITFRMSFGFNYRGTDFDSDRFHEVVHDVADLVAVISPEDQFPYFGWVVDRINGHHAKVERVFRELDKFFQHVVDYHLSPDRKKEQDDMIDVLLGIENQKEMHGLSSFTKDNVKGVLLNLFLGGIDTSANTLNWAMAELARNERVRKKAQDEVRSCVGKKGKVTAEDLDKLHYLRLVIKETWRLYPPVPLLVTRESISPSQIGGYDISPGTLVQVNAWGIARDPRYWKDPELFIPERFIDSSVDFRGQHFEFLAFGSGRRICPGINMGMATVELALANLLYCFDWKLPNGMKPEEFSMEEKESGLTIASIRKDPVDLVPVTYTP